MKHRKTKLNRKKSGPGIEELTGPGYDSLFVRTAWMNKLGQKKHKEPRALRKRPTDRRPAPTRSHRYR